MSRNTLAAGFLAMVVIGFLLITTPASAYQNTHTLTTSDSVSTALPLDLAGTTLYLHAKAPYDGTVQSWIHHGTTRAYCIQIDGNKCCEDQGSFPDNGLTYYHSTKATITSGTAVGMVTDNIKVKISGCSTGQQD